MKKLTRKGLYRLIRSKDHKLILYLAGQGYLWDYAKGIGEILTFSKHAHKEDYLLAQGGYKIYNVKNEPELVDIEHLELLVGRGQWQGHLLLTGLPTLKKIRSRIVPTEELVTEKGR